MHKQSQEAPKKSPGGTQEAARAIQKHPEAPTRHPETPRKGTRGILEAKYVKTNVFFNNICVVKQLRLDVT